MDLEQIKEYYKTSSGMLRLALSPFALTYCVLTGKHVCRLDVWLLTGKERHCGHPLTVAFSGSKQNKNYWARLAFDDLFDESYLGKHWGWRIPGLIQSCGENIDLFAELCDQTFSPSPSHTAPFSIPVSVEGDMDLDAINFSGKSIKKDLRKIEKNELSYEIVTDAVFLKNFAETIYPPCLNKKYPGECLFEPYRKLTLHYDRIEGLFITKEGRRISGALLCYKGDRVDFKCQATLPGCEELSRDGSTAAIDYYATVHFKANRWLNISLGGSRPFFHDGLLMWKKKWGLRLTRSGSMVQRLHLIQKNAAVRNFLIHNPFISVSRSGLVGVVFISGKNELTPEGQPPPATYAWPGLKRVIVYCLDQLPAPDSLQDDRIVFRSADELFESAQKG